MSSAIGPEHLGELVTVTLHRRLGELRGELVGVGRLGVDGRIEPFALVELEHGGHLETSLGTLTLDRREPAR